jgi:hypothetical protein
MFDFGTLADATAPKVHFRKTSLARSKTWVIVVALPASRRPARLACRFDGINVAPCDIGRALVSPACSCVTLTHPAVSKASANQFGELL